MDLSLSSDQKKWHKMQLILKNSQDLDKDSLNLQRKKIIIIRFLIENFLVFAFQYAGLNLALIQARMPIQLAMGTACAFIFLRGYSIIPGMMLGTFMAIHVLPMLTVLDIIKFICFFNLPVIGLFWLCCRSNIPTMIFYDIKKFLLFLCYLILMMGMGSLLTPFKFSLFDFLVNLNGVMVIGFSLVAWDAFYPQFKQNKIQINLFWYVIAFILTLALLAFLMTSNWIIMLTLAVFSILIMAYISYQFGWFVSTFIMFFVAMVLGFGCTIIHKEMYLLIYAKVIFFQAIICYFIAVYRQGEINGQIL